MQKVFCILLNFFLKLAEKGETLVRPGNSAFQADAFYPWRNNSIDIREGGSKGTTHGCFQTYITEDSKDLEFHNKLRVPW